MNSSPGTLLIVMLGLGVLPFALVLLTSFVKMAVVLSIVRSAMGTPQIPPNSVITGLALALSLVVVAPVAYEAGEHLQDAEKHVRTGDASGLLEKLGRSAEPVKRFLRLHTHTEHLAAFTRLSRQEGPGEETGWSALVPAFVVSQLHEAFELGFVVFLPFLVLDMMVASILLSLGMHMLSPTTISLPFKLLLFVFADGWTLLATNLLGGYLQG